MATTVTIYNNKGGSGKTMFAVNLAACLAVQGYRTLVIDSDDQCNATAYMNGLSLSPTIAEVYNLSERQLPVYESEYHKNLFLTPASGGLDLMDRQMFCRGEGEYLTLRRAMTNVVGDFDFIFIDTPPTSRSVLGYNALLASDFVLTPVDVDGLGGLFGLPKVLEFINEVISLHNNNLRWLGMVLNKCQNNWSTNEVINQAKEFLSQDNLEKSIFKTQVKYMNRLGNSSINKNPIIFSEPNGIGAANFTQLTKEFLKRIK
jgi:chromosome partitioning protein